MAQLTAETIKFLEHLKYNNNREWFNANKADYERAKSEFINFVDGLIVRIAEFDVDIRHQTAKDTVFRIFRDVRFSADKAPYKTHFGAYISASKSKSDIHSYAGYYIHIEPSGESFLAGGAYLPQGSWLKNIRKEIHYNGDEFREILNHKTFRKTFGEMDGEKLKSSPREYPKDHRDIELLKHKSFLALHKCPDKMVLSEEFGAHAASVFSALYPFNRFLNNARE
jgi:uncharacterized protein (TIGR02453 family)